MADDLKMDPQRIARLRDRARLKQVDPRRVLDVVSPHGDGVIVDVGAGVGYVSLPFARLFPHHLIIACDVLPGMLELLARDADEEQLRNVDTALMTDPAALPLADDSASLIIMLQVHHELDDAPGLLTHCHRVLVSGAPIVIVDWKDEDLPGMPGGGRRVAQSVIAADLRSAGFDAVCSHDIYPLHSVTIGTAR